MLSFFVVCVFFLVHSMYSLKAPLLPMILTERQALFVFSVYFIFDMRFRDLKKATTSTSHETTISRKKKCNHLGICFHGIIVRFSLINRYVYLARNNAESGCTIVKIEYNLLKHLTRWSFFLHRVG